MRSSRLLLTTATELNAIMAAAVEGLSERPIVGRRAPGNGHPGVGSGEVRACSPVLSFANPAPDTGPVSWTRSRAVADTGCQCGSGEVRESRWDIPAKPGPQCNDLKAVRNTGCDPI